MESKSFSTNGGDRKMFRLRDLKNGLYQIHKEKGPAYEGTPMSIFTQAVRMGIVQKELIAAVHMLTKNQDDYADFNDYGRLKFTRKNNK